LYIIKIYGKKIYIDKIFINYHLYNKLIYNKIDITETKIKIDYNNAKIFCKPIENNININNCILTDETINMVNINVIKMNV
jgi:hypothetical protein